MSLERDIRDAIVRSLRARGARPIKFYGCVYSEAGVPDLLICYRGRFIFLETKRPGEKPTPIQCNVMAELRAAGGFGGAVSSVPEALLYLDAVDSEIAYISCLESEACA